MHVALDTNRYSDFNDGDPDVLNICRNAQRIFLPLPVIAELRYGFLRGSRAKANEDRLKQFISKPSVQILSPDPNSASRYASIRRQIELAGRPIPVNDVWIAALCIQSDVALFTRDAHFQIVRGLRLL